jgi:Serine-pyruvate aminotransferase/archaeal aspartate aminotransferase
MPSSSIADISETVLRNGTFARIVIIHDLTAFVIISLQTYGAKVDQIKAEIGAAVSQPDVEKALKSKKYKVLTFTHVDTSTGTCFFLLPTIFNPIFVFSGLV